MTTQETKTRDLRPASRNTLLVIGAGEGQDIAPDWQERYQRLVLVEPLPELARTLRQTLGQQANVEVLEAAIVPGAKPGDTITFYEFNWAQASSRHQPAELLQLFPGLRTERMRRVSAISPQQLIQELDLPPEGEHGLVLEAPADEGPILHALIECSAHKSFSRIQLRHPAPGLYDTPTDPAAMLGALKANGFEVETQDRTDPDWPKISLTRNRLKIALEEAQQAVQALENQLAAQSEARVQAEKLLEERTRERDQQQDKRKALEKSLSEQEARNQSLQGKIQELEKTLQQANQARESEAAARTELEKQFTDAKSAVSKHTAERDEQAKRADEQAARAKQEAEARATAEKLAEERNRQLTERQQQLQRVQQEGAELQTRQTLLQEELVRAEAQIDLIKDLLLKEQSL
jgi:chemotaxis protein histidine kinase CheA